MSLAFTDLVKITDVAVSNSEGSIKLDDAVTRLRISSALAYEIRVEAGGTGLPIKATDPPELFENIDSWRGRTLYIFSAGSGSVTVMEELGLIG